MSSYVVSNNHLKALVSSLARFSIERKVYFGDRLFDLGLTRDLTRLVNILLAENWRSVEADRAEEPTEPPKIQYRSFRKLTPVEALKACECYDYQACEVENYRDTQAAQIVNRIRTIAIRKLSGFEEAAWEIK